MELRLEVLDGRLRGHAFAVPVGDALVLGRGPEAQLLLPEPSVSRQHCEVWRAGCGVWVRDRQSRGGTSVNGVPAPGPSGHPVRPGDLIRVGGLHLRLEAGLRIEPGWLTWDGGVVPALARRIREEADFAALPVLADALLDAGCADEDLLAHCRSPGPHVRGCWALHLLLRAS